jgi:membrane associated rhomboid family serine protease
LIPLRDFQPSGTFPILTISIILINVVVFGYQFFLGDQYSTEEPVYWVQGWIAAGCDVDPALTDLLSGSPLTAEEVLAFRYGAMPCKITHPQHKIPPYIPLAVWITLFTSMFMHAGFLHILGNMWFLWIFGDNIEDTLGRGNFIIFYLFTGLVAAFAQVIADPDSVTPMVGASGAISGVLGAYLVFFPYGRVLTLIPLVFIFFTNIHVPAIIFLGIWFLLQFVGGLSSSVAGGGVAYWAHAGGFLAGAAIALLWKFSKGRRA